MTRNENQPLKNPIPFNPLYKLTGRQLVRCADSLSSLFDNALREDITDEQLGLQVRSILEHTNKYGL